MGLFFFILKSNFSRLCERLESWLDLSENYNNAHPLSPTTPTTYKQLQDMHTDGKFFYSLLFTS